MPVYTRTRGKWLVRIYHKGRPLSWIVEGTKREAEEYEARKRLDLAAGVHEARTVPKFSQLCADHYRPHAELHLKPSWWKKQEYILATLIEYFGDDDPRTIDAAAVEQFARKRLRDKLKPVSVNNELRVLRRVLSFARERGYLLVEPRWKSLREGGSDRVRAWSYEDLQRLYAACLDGGKGCDGRTIKPHPDLLPLLVFLANTGARKGEALALTWDHVDLARGQIQIWPSAEWQPKSGRPREVPISDALLPWLKADRRSERWVFPCRRRDPKTRELCRYAYWPQLQFDEVREAAGLEGGPHTLRHTFATHFLAREPDIHLLADVLGHSDVAVTRLYAHLLPDHLARARNAVNFAAPVGPATLESRRRWR